jgi:hypothetical protein
LLRTDPGDDRSLGNDRLKRVQDVFRAELEATVKQKENQIKGQRTDKGYSRSSEPRGGDFEAADVLALVRRKVKLVLIA